MKRIGFCFPNMWDVENHRRKIVEKLSQIIKSSPKLNFSVIHGSRSIMINCEGKETLMKFYDCSDENFFFFVRGMDFDHFITSPAVDHFEKVMCEMNLTRQLATLKRNSAMAQEVTA